jgi:hypothetical protein
MPEPTSGNLFEMGVLTIQNTASETFTLLEVVGRDSNLTSSVFSSRAGCVPLRRGLDRLLAGAEN